MSHLRGHRWSPVRRPCRNRWIHHDPCVSLSVSTLITNVNGLFRKPFSWVPSWSRMGSRFPEVPHAMGLVNIILYEVLEADEWQNTTLHPPWKHLVSPLCSSRARKRHGWTLKRISLQQPCDHVNCIIVCLEPMAAEVSRCGGPMQLIHAKWHVTCWEI
jgi:hypothetical protein